MSLLLQAPLGANVDGSGLSLHADGRTSRDIFPMAVGAEDVANEGQKHGHSSVSSCFIFSVRRVSWEDMN